MGSLDRFDDFEDAEAEREEIAAEIRFALERGRRSGLQPIVAAHGPQWSKDAWKPSAPVKPIHRPSSSGPARWGEPSIFSFSGYDAYLADRYLRPRAPQPRTPQLSGPIGNVIAIVLVMVMLRVLVERPEVVGRFFEASRFLLEQRPTAAPLTLPPQPSR